jgi:hypothetical protein
MCAFSLLHSFGDQKKVKRDNTSPLINKIKLDYSISIVMMTDAPPLPPPRGGGGKGSDPFQSPFGNKPFS